MNKFTPTSPVKELKNHEIFKTELNLIVTLPFTATDSYDGDAGLRFCFNGATANVDSLFAVEYYCWENGDCEQQQVYAGDAAVELFNHYRDKIEGKS